MKNWRLSTKKRKKGRKLRLTICLLLFLSFAWIKTAFISMPSAKAETLDELPFVVALESEVVDKVLGAGTTDKIQGKVEQDIGTVERNLGEIKGQAKGAAKQIEGRAKQDIGEVKSRMDEASSDLEEASESAMDAIKHFFGQ